MHLYVNPNYLNKNEEQFLIINQWKRTTKDKHARSSVLSDRYVLLPGQTNFWLPFEVVNSNINLPAVYMQNMHTFEYITKMQAHGSQGCWACCSTPSICFSQGVLIWKFAPMLLATLSTPSKTQWFPSSWSLHMVMEYDNFLCMIMSLIRRWDRNKLLNSDHSGPLHGNL